MAIIRSGLVPIELSKLQGRGSEIFREGFARPEKESKLIDGEGRILDERITFFDDSTGAEVKHIPGSQGEVIQHAYTQEVNGLGLAMLQDWFKEQKMQISIRPSRPADSYTRIGIPSGTLTSQEKSEIQLLDASGTKIIATIPFTIQLEAVLEKGHYKLSSFSVTPGFIARVLAEKLEFSEPDGMIDEFQGNGIEGTRISVRINDIKGRIEMIIAGYKDQYMERFFGGRGGKPEKIEQALLRALTHFKDDETVDAKVFLMYAPAGKESIKTALEIGRYTGSSKKYLELIESLRSATLSPSIRPGGP